MSPEDGISLIAQMFSNPDKYRNQYVDGHFVDKSGQQTDVPYQTPGFFQRAFNPDARQLVAINRQWQLAQPQADLQRQVALSQLSKNFSNLSPTEQQTFGSPEAWYAQTGGVAPGTDSSFVARLNEEKQRAAEAYNATEKATTEGLLGVPTRSAIQTGDTLQHAGNVVRGLIARDPYTNYNEALKLGNDLTYNQRNVPQTLENQYNQELWKGAAIPSEGEANLRESQVANELAGVKLGNVGNLGATLQNQIQKESALSPLVGQPDALSPYSLMYKDGRISTQDNPLRSPLLGGGPAQVPGLPNYFQPSGLPSQSLGSSINPAPRQQPQYVESKQLPGYMYDANNPSNVVYKGDTGLQPVTDPALIKKLEQEAKGEVKKVEQKAKKNEELPHGTQEVLKSGLIGTGQTLASPFTQPIVNPYNQLGQQTRQLISHWISGE